MLLGRIRDAYPEVSVQLRVGSSDDLIEGVRGGTFDLAVVGLADEIQPTGVAHRVLKREALVAVVPNGPRWSRGRRRFGKRSRHRPSDAALAALGNRQGDRIAADIAPLALTVDQGDRVDSAALDRGLLDEG